MENTKQKILIIETAASHQDFLATLIILSLKTGHEVVVFSTNEVFRQTVPLIRTYSAKIDWHLYDLAGGLLTKLIYFMDIKKYMNKHKALLLVDSLYCFSNWMLVFFALFRFDGPLYLGSGRTNLCFERDSAQPLLKQMLRFFLMKIAVNKFEGLIIHSKEYFAYLNAIGYRKKILLLPWYLKEKEQDKHYVKEQMQTSVKFGIVGAIQEYRRDYLGVLKVFEELWSEGHHQFQLDLIGRPIGEYGEKVINMCEAFQAMEYPVAFTRKFLEMDVFLDKVSKCDCLIAPMKTECYQRNQSSSVVTEQIRFDKIAIVPDSYKIAELETSTLYYENIAELKQIIIGNFNDVNIFNRLKCAALDNASNYIFDNYTKSFCGFLSDGSPVAARG